jgi:hypothetical protein
MAAKRPSEDAESGPSKEPRSQDEEVAAFWEQCSDNQKKAYRILAGAGPLDKHVQASKNFISFREARFVAAASAAASFAAWSPPL